MFDQLNQLTAKPEIWSEYTADRLWTDPHIADQMLGFHLNPDVDAASRSFEFIEASVNWLVTQFALGNGARTIDFGCGPGLYTQRLKAAGIGTVVGLDFSRNSLGFAAEQAKASGLSIEYHLGNYLAFSDDRTFDLITLVMCDLCALSPSQRSQLLGKFKSMLAPDGVIALDVYTASRFADQIESVTLEKNAMNGFWSKDDYWCVQSTFKYEAELVTLDKYVICQTDKEWEVYNWLQHFTMDMLAAELKSHGLEILESYADLRGTAFNAGDEMALILGHG